MFSAKYTIQQKNVNMMIIQIGVLIAHHALAFIQKKKRVPLKSLRTTNRKDPTLM